MTHWLSNMDSRDASASKNCFNWLQTAWRKWHSNQHFGKWLGTTWCWLYLGQTAAQLGCHSCLPAAIPLFPSSCQVWPAINSTRNTTRWTRSESIQEAHHAQLVKVMWGFAQISWQFSFKNPGSLFGWKVVEAVAQHSTTTLRPAGGEIRIAHSISRSRIALFMEHLNQTRRLSYKHISIK